MSETPIVSLDDVSIHFNQGSGVASKLVGGPRTVRAVQDVSVDVYENDVVALVGESGCGKTTLGKTAIGLQQPTEGTVRYRGQDVWRAKRGKGSIPFSQIRRSLQIIHQDPGGSLDPMRTIIAQLSDPLKRWNPELDSAQRRARVFSMLERVGMVPSDSYAFRYPHQLSGGEKQRVALVRAFLLQPDLILADEAISALDVSLRIDMMDLMLDLQDVFDTSYLFISHNLSNARYLTEKTDGRIGIMYLGRLVEFGPVEQIIENPQHPYTKVLVWATPSLKEYETEVQDPPLRELDVPDPVDPPSGCPFQTRCPEARVACTEELPELRVTGDGGSHFVACYRASDDPEYRESPAVE